MSTKLKSYTPQHSAKNLLSVESLRKQSLSLTSLPPSSGLEGNYETARVRAERPYNSLKKRRDSQRDQHRRSWESGQSLSSLFNYSGTASKDDFWAALQNNYDYIMDTNLIDTCKETGWEIERSVPICDDITDLLTPTHQEWPEPEGNVCEETTKLRRWLRDVEQRLNLHTFSAATRWPKAELQKELAEHLDLQREICAQGRAVGALVRACGGAQTCPKGARGLEKRYHLLYLRAIEWQCHLEGLLGTRNTPSPVSTRTPSDTDEEPAPKLPRLSADSGGSTGESRGSGSTQHSTESQDSQYERYRTNKRKSDSSSGSQSDYSEPISSDDDDVPLVADAFEGDVESLDGDFVPLQIVGDFVTHKPAVMLKNNPCDMDTEPDFIETLTQKKLSDTVIKREINKYNRPNKPDAKNLATFYFKHHDTDSEMDRKTMESENEQQSEDAKSEYENEKHNEKQENDLGMNDLNNHNEKNVNMEKMNFNQKPLIKINNLQERISPKANWRHSSKDDIQKLVREVDYIVRDKNEKGRIGKHGRSKSFEPLSLESNDHNSYAKMTRIKEWLLKSRTPGPLQPVAPLDSCDASGECTSGDSDTGNSRDSSGDPSGSVSTFRPVMNGSQCTSFELIDNDFEMDTAENSPVKVIRRSNRTHSARPWSVSCFSQLEMGVAPMTNSVGTLESPPESPKQRGLAQFSISESALNVLGSHRSTPRSDSKGELRRRKLRTRKRQSRKSESCSDGLHIGSSPTSPQGLSVLNSRALVKSSSFSGHPQIIPELALMDAIEPVESAIPTVDETVQYELQPLGAISFEIGGNVTNATDPAAALVNIPSEEHSSLSLAEAWDNYQDNYLSESYSECVDTEAARRLLEFGEDYRNHFDSQSDCCSSLSNFAPNLEGDRRAILHPMNAVGGSDLVNRNAEAMNKLKNAQDFSDFEIRKRKTEMNQRRRSSAKESSVLERRNSQLLLDDSDSCESSISKRKNSTIANKSISQQDFETPKRKLSAKSKSKRATLSETDTESEEMTRLINESKTQLDHAEELWGQTTSKANHHGHAHGGHLNHGGHFMLEPHDYAEIIVTCRENIRCLDAVMTRACGALLAPSQSRNVRELLSRWEALRSSTDSFMAARDLHVALLALRTSLRALGTPSTFPDSEKQLESAIEELQEQQLGLEEQKKTMLKLNLAVHSLITTYTNSVAATAEIVETTTTTTVVTSEILSNGRNHQSVTTSDNVNSSSTTDIGVSTVTDKISLDTESGLSSLKDEVIDVYREWDDAGQRITARLAQYSSALAAWRQWESGLGALQSALRGDERTLEGLNGALRQGQGGPQIAEGVRDVAKLLSEKTEINSSVLPAATMVVTVPGALPMDGGSLSDSGISDGGSDWGLSERERRLGALRRLHRQLEQALAPGSAALQAITKRMEQAEVDLRALQISCKELIARTAAQEVARNAQTPRKTSRSPNSKRKNRRKSNNSSSSSTTSTTKVSPESGDPHGDDDPNSPKNSGWAWRVAKAAVPLQIALVALFCAACLLEPHCCDALNTWTLTLAPQLRYVRGPPPV